MPDPGAAMIEALGTIVQILHRYAPRSAVSVEELLAAARAGVPDLGERLCSPVLWGDGGLWDTGPQVLQRPHHDPEVCRRDELAYRAAFLALAEHIERERLGAEHERRVVREVADMFRAWERDGL